MKTVRDNDIKPKGGCQGTIGGYYRLLKNFGYFVFWLFWPFWLYNQKGPPKQHWTVIHSEIYILETYADRVPRSDCGF